MTDNEIIKALENILDEKIGCCKEDCSFYDGKVHSCEKTIAKHSLDLIKRQQAEIERLKAVFENSQKTTKYWYGKCDELVEELNTAKNKTVIVFANKLVNKLDILCKSLRNFEQKFAITQAMVVIRKIFKEMINDN